jgi:hypothetical protein
MKKTLLTLALFVPAYAMAEDSPKAEPQKEAQANSEMPRTDTGETTGARETICKQDTRIRKVTLSQGDDGLACKVSYLKESQAAGEEKVLWSAKQKSDYCQQQATAFVEKLKSWGWSCQ